MSFDANAYQALLQVNPAAAAQYLASTTAQAAPAAQPQGFGTPQPSAQAAPAPVLARGTVEDYLNQPQMTSGGKSVTSFYNGKPQGTWLDFLVKRDMLNTDVRQQTDINGVPQTYRDGTPKWVLIVPVQVIGASDPSFTQFFENGDGTLWLKGLLQEEISRAMAAAGDSSGIPKGGARIILASAGEKPSRKAGYSASKLHQAQYQAPAGGSAPAAPVTPPAPVEVPAAPVVAPVPTVASPATVTGSPAITPVADPATAALLARLRGEQG
jgi:hypothetical protein